MTNQCERTNRPSY